MTNDLLKGHVDLLLLAIVADEPAHGYAIIERLWERSAGTFDLPEGTVYPALHRLEKAGLLAGTWTTANGRRRRVYELSMAGRESLRERTVEWQSLNSGVARVIAPSHQHAEAAQ